MVQSHGVVVDRGPCLPLLPLGGYGLFTSGAVGPSSRWWGACSCRRCAHLAGERPAPRPSSPLSSPSTFFTSPHGYRYLGDFGASVTLGDVARTATTAGTAGLVPKGPPGPSRRLKSFG